MGNKRAGINDERGAVAVLVAASLVMLMGFAAIAVDTGAAFSERRQDQSAADMASMAALQFARGSSNPVTAANNGAAQAVAVANASLDDPAAANWGTCVDATPLAVVSSTYPCVSFTGNLQRSRVVIPTVAVHTSFGAVIGVNSIETSALAEAQADLGQEGRIIPFGLPSGSAGSTEICLRDSNNLPPPCDGPDEGNFGTVDFSIYGNTSLNTIQHCNPNQNSLETNIAVGADHPLATVDGQVREDQDYCGIFNARPNHIWGRTGIGSAFYPGIVGGTSAYLTTAEPGRLARGSNRVSVESGSPNLDNTPLWTYLNGTGPGSCNSVTSTADMAICINDYRSGGWTNAIFDLSIGGAVRFGAVPQLDATVWGSGASQLYGIVDLVPVYLQATYWKCAGSGSCEIIHFPGDPTASSGLGNTVNGGNRIDGLSAFLLDIDMLPEPLKSNFPATAEQVDYALIK